MSQKEQKKNPVKVIIALLAAILLVGGYFAFGLYNTYFAGNVSGEQQYLYIRTGATYDDLTKNLAENNALKHLNSFKKAAAKMNLSSAVKPGRYRLTKGMNNRSLINMIKSGNQSPVQLKIQGMRKKENFAGYLAKNLEADSLRFIQLLDSTQLAEQHGFTTENIYTMFVPNTYEIYWNTSPEEFFAKMYKEFEKFWTPARKQKAEALKMTPQKVVILASIVDAEALYDVEMPTIAGLYLNRLNRGILLQADPTVIFANNDFTVKRVTYALLRVDSRYNTYKYAGLPPGPIMMPSIKAIDAVLNYEKNNYIYMCAKEDFSGYHRFAATVQEHDANAKKYRDALNKRNIFR